MNVQEIQNIRKAYHEQIVILVVEDHMLFCREIRHALPQHNVIFARTVEQAKAQYDQHMPNITFLDIDLPDGDGFSVLDYIKQHDPAAYVIILTGSKLQDDITAAQQRGAQGYIIKPSPRSRFEHYINDYMKFRERNMKSTLEEIEQHRIKALKDLSADTIID